MNVYLIAAAAPEAPVTASFMDHFKEITFGWFDIVVLILLVVGFFHGRKRGMSGELVDLMGVLAMVVAAGEYYSPVSGFITKFTNLAMPWANLVAYGAIIFAIITAFGVLKSKMGSKLVGSDLFGRGEYYMGACAGVVRYFCYFVIFLSVVNSRAVSEQQAEEDVKAQLKQYDSNFFPTPIQVQVAIVYRSFISTLVRKGMDRQLLQSVSYSGPATITPAEPAWKAKDPTEGIK